MNYQKIYDDLINRARVRCLSDDIYVERHHVIPRCLEGTDDPENIVRLIPEEHYVAHQLLVKLNPGHAGLSYAAILMSTHNTENRITNKLYGWLRRTHSKNMKIKSRPPMPETTRLALRKANVGRKFSDETKQKISRAAIGRPAHNKGVPISEEVKLKVSQANKGRSPPNKGKTGFKQSEETKRKMSETRKGKLKGPMSEYQKIKISETKKLNHQRKLMGKLMECLL